MSAADGLGPLPETTLAEIRNDSLHQTQLSDTGAAYWGSNWREVRKLYTADEMRAYAAEQVAAERERCAQIVDDLVRAVDGADAIAAIRRPTAPGQAP